MIGVLAAGAAADMGRYYFRVHDSGGLVPDEEGRELPDLETVRKQALKGARSIISDDVTRGYVDMERRIEVLDEAGATVLEIPFSEAVTFGGTPPRPAG